MKRKKPSFNETYYGFRTFSHLLEDAQRRNIVVLRRDQKSGSYIVEDLGTAASAAAPAAAAVPRSAEVKPAETGTNGSTAAAATPEAAAEQANGSRTPRRRRSRGGRGRGRAASTLAPGAEGSADGQDLDDAEDGDDEMSAESGESVAGDDVSTAPDAQEPSAEPDHGTERAADPETPRTEPERAFSLFSWIRRPPAE